MPSVLTPRKLRLLQLPIVLSEVAWLQTVHINDYLFEELSDRLSAVLDASYRAVMSESDGANRIPFSLWLIPSSRNRVDKVRIDLLLEIQYLGKHPRHLRVLLNDELESSV
ncbi:hypothetical protein [Pseudomonas sp. Irchel 3A5]|uniref:hypothetical protein n=1 Tax=Pseudomonas sp. Irchel 3A5 TaxID=2008911 RepID=UPI000BA4D4AF|nr:hypothetical protein [Pseudomonas sp. Irchel 3A5]